MTIAVALVLFRGRTILDQPGLPARTLTLGKWGYAVNTIALIFAFGVQIAVLRLSTASYQLTITVTSIFFCFPPAIPVTSGSTMNYVVVRPIRVSMIALY